MWVTSEKMLFESFWFTTQRGRYQQGETSEKQSKRNDRHKLQNRHIKVAAKADLKKKCVNS